MRSRSPRQVISGSETLWSSDRSVSNAVYYWDDLGHLSDFSWAVPHLEAKSRYDRSARGMAEAGLTSTRAGSLGRALVGTYRVPAWSLAVLAMFSVQVASALSTGLFAQVGAAGTAWLRLTAGAAMFLALARPRLRDRSRSELLGAVALGAATGALSVCFLSAIERIPLGTAVAIEFLGPLVVAVAGTRTRLGLAWPALAVVGVLLLTQPWVGSVDPVGILWAVGAAAAWGLYVLLSARVGRRFQGVEGLAITIPIAAVVTASVGLPQAVGHITWQVIAAVVGIALLMPALALSLEMLALRRITTTAFGTLMALEPAIGMAVGMAVLAQGPTAMQVAGTGLVVVAGIGATRPGRAWRTDRSDLATEGQPLQPDCPPRRSHSAPLDGCSG